MNTRTRIGRREAVAFNARWSDADRAVIREQVERLDDEVGPVVFEVPPSRQYVVVLDAEGANVASLDGGMIRFAPSAAPGHAIRVPRGNGQAGDEWALYLTLAERPDARRRNR